MFTTQLKTRWPRFACTTNTTRYVARDRSISKTNSNECTRLVASVAGRCRTTAWTSRPSSCSIRPEFSQHRRFTRQCWGVMPKKFCCLWSGPVLWNWLLTSVYNTELSLFPLRTEEILLLQSSSAWSAALVVVFDYKNARTLKFLNWAELNRGVFH